MIELTGSDAQAVLPVRRWADELLARSPYPSLDDLIRTAEQLVRGGSDAELDEAARAVTAPLDTAGLERTDEGEDAAVVRGAEVYEERFGRPFVTDGPEPLEDLQRRLKNDPAEEADEVRAQLARLAARRLRERFGSARP